MNPHNALWPVRLRNAAIAGALALGTGMALAAPPVLVDGSATEWSGTNALASAGNQKVSVLKAIVQGSDVFILIQGQNLGPNYSLYLNTDNNVATGYQADTYKGSGADYLFSGGLLYKNTRTGSGWNWSAPLVANVSVAANANVLEVRIPLAALGLNPAQSGSVPSIGLGFQLLTANWASDSQLPLASSAFVKLALTPTPTPTPTPKPTPTPTPTPIPTPKPTPTPTPIPTPTPTPIPGTTSVSYVADSTTIFPNPDRGFYTTSTSCTFDLASLKNYRSQNISLVLCEVNLASFVNANISAATLTNFNNAMGLVRQAGMKAIVRFGYSWSDGARPQDTSKAWMLTHIAQLKPFLQSNGDVISTMQAGFIGIWGEWYYTDYFGNNGVISAAQWKDRQDVLEAVLNALPASRTVQVRTPAIKQRLYGSTPLAANEAFANTFKARLGHHNDCFLASSDDFGTYTNVSADKAYLGKDALFTPQGGETCAVSNWSGWVNAEKDMRSLHYSYLNKDYNTLVLNSWGSNIDLAKRNLGYRLTLTQGSYSTSAASGGSLALNFSIRNDGYAAPYNQRRVELILRNTSTGSRYPFSLNVDPRRWTPGSTSVVSQNVSLTGVPAGSYALWLNLPDAAPALAARPDYSIRLANGGGIWDAATGYHNLNHTVSVTGALPTPTPASAKVYIVGDSTVAKYSAAENPITGWGDRMVNYFKPNISFDDRAIGGISSKSFINGGHFNPILAQIKPKDYLLIQFGHNDCCSGDASVKAAAQTEYKQYLRQFIDGARSKGAIPVLVTPMNTRTVQNGSFIYNPSLAPYAQAMRELAQEKNTPLIDLASKSVNYLNSIGYAASANVFVVLAAGTYPNYPYARNDDVHFQDYGATQLARMVAEGLKENKLEPLAGSMK